MIKKSELRNELYYFGTGHNTFIGKWNTATNSFNFIDEDGTVKSLPHYDDNPEIGFGPRCEVVSMYIMSKNMLTLVNKCSKHGWDNREAVPIPLDIYEKLSIFINVFVHNLPMLGAEIDGSITLEWIKHNEYLTVNINGSDIYRYKSNIDNKDYEGIFIKNDIPDIIFELVQKLG